MVSVFVYGTLLVGESNHRVAKPYLKDVQPGKVKGRLYSVGAFPALVLDEDKGREIEGEWFTVAEEGLAAMDWLEGYRGPGMANFYDRVWVKDMENNREGWVYVWNDSKGRPEIECGSWRRHIGESLKDAHV
jgi:gamma-glutamylcyclotransferase (GGCT)/AIG2-like uncharacterized protein YtfP